MSSTDELPAVAENYSDENLPADKSASEYKVTSPQRSILKDLNRDICNVLHSSPQSVDTVKVITGLSLFYHHHRSCCCCVACSFSALTLMVGSQKGHLPPANLQNFCRKPSGDQPRLEYVLKNRLL